MEPCVGTKIPESRLQSYAVFLRIRAWTARRTLSDIPWRSECDWESLKSLKSKRKNVFNIDRMISSLAVAVSVHSSVHAWLSLTRHQLPPVQEVRPDCQCPRYNIQCHFDFLVCITCWSLSSSSETWCCYGMQESLGKTFRRAAHQTSFIWIFPVLVSLNKAYYAHTRIKLQKFHYNE